MENVKTIHVLNLGAGVQSTCLYLMSITGELPRFDYAIFADTHEEPKAVYQHLEWLKSLGGPPILEVCSGNLGEDLLQGQNSTGQKFVTIPAFTRSGERLKVGQVRRQCTKEYKINVVEKTIRRTILQVAPKCRVPKDIHVTQSYGITVDEAGRAQRIQRNWKHKWTSPRFPLLEKFMGRMDCVRWLRAYGIPHEVPRSACVFCPYKSNAEWRFLRDTDPSGWLRAIQIDEALRLSGNVLHRNANSDLFLHRSCVPLKDAIIDENPHEVGFAIECTGGCGL
jgi:hypothetical protein